MLDTGAAEHGRRKVATSTTIEKRILSYIKDTYPINLGGGAWRHFNARHELGLGCVNPCRFNPTQCYRIEYEYEYVSGSSSSSVKVRDDSGEPRCLVGLP